MLRVARFRISLLVVKINVSSITWPVQDSSCSISLLSSTCKNSRKARATALLGAVDVLSLSLV